MSDSETPQHNPEPDSTPDPSVGGPANGAPEPVNDGLEQGSQSPAPSATQPQSTNGDSGSGSEAAAPSPRRDRLAGVKRLVAQNRKIVWATVAVLCVVAGTVGSVLGAHSAANNNTDTSQATFQQGSRAIASTLKLAIQRQEELTVAAATYFAAYPKASAAEFAAWVRWARTRHRYPELDALGLLPAPAAPAPSRASTTTSASSTSAPASTAAVRSLTPVHTSPTAAHPSPAPVHVPPALALSRDTGLSVYTTVSAGQRQALVIETPVYRGNVTPRSVFGRRMASVGWLREVLVPGALLGQVLVGHPGYALQVGYRPDSSNRAHSFAFASGSPQSGAQSATANLHSGWTVTSFGPASGASVFSDGDALAVLIGGILLSTLLGLLVFVLGATRRPAPMPATETQAEPDDSGEPAESNLYERVTGVPNRALTLDRAERMVARAGRDSGMLAGALFVDIDQLKELNEKLGLRAGDQLLRIVGERLQDVVRTGDTVGRIGGDEFVVLVESAARGVRLDSLAQRMIEALHKPVELDDFGPSFVLTASIGVAFGRYETPEDLLRDANVALASAKAAGKDRYTLFNANMRTVIEGRAVLEAELSTALAENQFFLLYQPIYDLSTRRVRALEALIRWQHPTQGVLAPTDFIPLAEETGLIVPIGRFMLEAACGRAAAWDVAGGAAGDAAGGVAGGAATGGSGRVGVSVKVSAHQLNRDGFTTDVQRALQQSGIEPSLLTLQIPETAVMRDLAVAANRLREIKALGVSIAIDDFGGSGYAHHADLRQMPLDSLRVDRSSLAASEDESYRSWLLEAILVVGRDLELTVVATGIETQEQMAVLQTLGCTMAQGALLSPPTPADAVESLLTAYPTAHAATSTSQLTDPAWHG
jgi:diguanylate cyclase (GGDEF)-like protein